MDDNQAATRGELISKTQVGTAACQMSLFLSARFALKREWRSLFDKE